MIDTHCHIDDPQYAEGLDAFLTEQHQNGVEAILVPGVDKTSVKDVLEVCDRYPDYLFPALGLHPENVKEDWQEQLAIIKVAVDERLASTLYTLHPTPYTIHSTLYTLHP
ncbi:MAG: TatD family hydrolase, partial [Paludibacteraceae bacterium]|nr:TatD family hydrolase [Paludibacteraceae bacterium]